MIFPAARSSLSKSVRRFVENVHYVPVIIGHFVGGEPLAVIELKCGYAQRDGRIGRQQYAADFAQ